MSKMRLIISLVNINDLVLFTILGLIVSISPPTKHVSCWGHTWHHSILGFPYFWYFQKVSQIMLGCLFQHCLGMNYLYARYPVMDMGADKTGHGFIKLAAWYRHTKTGWGGGAGFGSNYKCWSNFDVSTMHRQHWHFLGSVFCNE